MDYNVTWEIEVSADDANQAAIAARQAQIRPGTHALFFNVTPDNSHDSEQIDLLELMDEGEYEESNPVLLSDPSDLATVLAALRLFQKTYQDCDAATLAADFPDHFTIGEPQDGDPKAVAHPIPLGTEDIDVLCERLNFGNDKAAKSTHLADLLLAKFPWLATPNDTDVSGSDVIQDLDLLYASLKDGDPEPTNDAVADVVIVVEGGLVQDILSTKYINAAVIDYDTEGSDREDIALIPRGKDEEPAEAYVAERSCDVMPDRVAELFEAIANPQRPSHE